MSEASDAQQWLERTRASGDLSELLDEIPYARHIGVSVAEDTQGLVFSLAPHAHNIGNILLPALHGGVVAAFMETAGTLELMLAARTARLPKVIDFSIDYLRTAQPMPTQAHCTLVREGKRLANVRVIAWQRDETQPVASARMHFLLSEPPSA